MFNKNLIISIVALVLLGGGAILFFSRSDSSVPNSANSEQGVKNLSQESAEKIIRESLERVLPYVQHIGYDPQRGGYVAGVIVLGGPTNYTLQGLEKEGFVKIISRDNNLGNVYDFTDKAKPYLRKDDKDPNYSYLTLGKLTSIKISLTEPVDSERGKVIYADTEETYEINPIGKIGRSAEYGSELTTTFSRKIPFILYQDGWRIDASGGY